MSTRPADIGGFVARVQRAIQAGLRGILLREPQLDDGPYLKLAQALAALLEPVDGWLGIHDRVHLVQGAGAHGVHLGFRSLQPTEARSLVGTGVAIGLSTHHGDVPEVWEAADYRFFGPIYDTPSKRGLLEPVGLSGLRASVAEAGAPVWALGGLRPDRLDEVLGAGARGAALLAGLLGAEDVAGATRSALASLGKGARGEAPAGGSGQTGEPHLERGAADRREPGERKPGSGSGGKDAG